ncbi:helix-turn-helix domain-containing protein, partial [Enterococcus faecalis]
IYAFSYKLNLILGNLRIKLKSSGLVGEEKNIGSFCFQCLYYFYGSNQERLPKILLENSPGIKGFIKNLQLMYQRTLSIKQSA